MNELNTYRVSGYAMIPAEYAVNIEANSPEEAVQIAQARFRKDGSLWYQNNTEDTCAASRWEPTAELIDRKEASRGR